MTSRIGIDCRFAALSVGIGTYTRGIVSALSRVERKYDLVLFVRSTGEDWLRAISENVTFVEADIPHYSFAEQRRMPRILKNASIDLLYAPHFNIPLHCPVPFVVTIHDLILHRYPNDARFARQVAYRFLMHRAVTKAQHIIAVSDFTRSELLSAYGRTEIPEISVVTEGRDDSFVPVDDLRVLEAYDLQPGYFLYVGTAKQHKNVQMLIDAHALCATDIPLVIVTNGKEADGLAVGSDVRILRGVGHRDLPALYSGAGCFVTASAYEGFCLPILEARSCGCPVIATDASAIPEIAGEHALLTDPTLQAMAAAMQAPPVYADPPEPRYDWDQSAIALDGILQSVLHG